MDFWNKKVWEEGLVKASKGEIKGDMIASYSYLKSSYKDDRARIFSALPYWPDMGSTATEGAEQTLGKSFSIGR